MTFSEFLEIANPDHIFSLLALGAILIPFWFLVIGFVLHVLGLIAYQVKNKHVRRLAHRHLSIVGFWSAKKIEEKCPLECKNCERCDRHNCAGYIAAHSLWRYRKEDEQK